VEDGIRVTIVEPGAVATELTNHITDEEVLEVVKATQEMEHLSRRTSQMPWPTP
jgi:NADP-dependent 3-hydroxy acid dehydrogenase YdfG